MELTPNLGLKKPGLTDNVLISDINENMEVLDAAVSEIQKGSTSIPNLETTDKELAGAINEVNNKANTIQQQFTAHLEEIMPHKYFDNGKWYRWGFRTTGGEPEFIYEEVL
ncbi:hypothetical protein [Lysinibacillus sp. FSL W8-0992]|uniref:hypothetical protein n=1 Tax=Lysinibacillus sp. FSL W8-0992 TaxID=2954643 RepID=UPI0030F5B207